MSCNPNSQNDPQGWLGDVSSSALDGLDAHIDDLKARGLTPSIIGKAGGPVGDVYDIYQIGKAALEGGWTPALVNLSGALGGAAGAAAMGVAFVAATGGVGAVGIIAIGAASYIGSEIGEALGEFLFDPTLEPEFYEETLRNREWRLRMNGIDPESDPGYQNIRRQLEKARRRAGIPSPSDCPMEDIKEKTRTASNFASPIVLDLDGDGVIRTVGLTSGVNFDHAADGFAERTGWVAPGDGLLVWDGNANGAIDSGRELFGSETLLPNGMKAINGFDALKAFDVNGDGVIDANDPVFAQLRVWVDANTDARTGEGELLTLEQAGVRSINLTYSESGFVDAQGNAHRQVGSYTTTDGQTRAATDVWFTSDVTNSLPTEWVEVPEDIAALPDAQGYGNVRELQQAAAQSGSVAGVLARFQGATTRAEQKALLDPLLSAWADTSGMAGSLEERAAGKYRIVYEAFGNERRSNNIDTIAFAALSSGSGSGGAALLTDFGGMYLSEHYRNLIAEWSRKLHVLEAFNGQYFFNLPEQKSQTDGANWGLSVSAGSGGGSSGSGAVAIASLPTLRVNFSQAQLDLLQQAYDSLRESVYASLALQTRLKPYLGAIELIIDEPLPARTGRAWPTSTTSSKPYRRRRGEVIVCDVARLRTMKRGGWRRER